MRGKAVRQRPEHVVPEYLEIPKDFYQLHHFFYFDRGCHVCQCNTIFTTFSQDIRFGTAEHVPSHTAKQLDKLLLKIVKIYAIGGFFVRNVLMDGELEKVKPEVELLDINIYAAHEHVGKIERYHRTLKER